MYEMTPMQADQPRTRKRLVIALSASAVFLGGIATVLLTGVFANAAGMCGGG